MSSTSGHPDKRSFGSLKNASQDPYRRTYGKQRRTENGRTRQGQRYFCYTHQPNEMSRDVRQDNLLLMIISGLHPHTIVEEPGFVQFLQSVWPNCPSANVILSELKKLFLTTTRFVRDQLEGVHHVTLTCEVWKTTENKTYMTTTSHLIDDGWSHRSLVLETTPLPEEHTPSNVAVQLLRIAQNWRIENKIKVVITNIDEIKREIKNNGWEHIPCLAHTLDVVFKDTLKISQDWVKLVQRCCEIVKYFSLNLEAQSKLKEAQYIYNLPPHQLVECRDKKWLSIMKMLEAITEQREAIKNVLISSNVDLLLSMHEHNNITKALSCLKAFPGVMTAEPAKRYSLLSNVIPQVEEIKKKLDELQKSGNKFAKELAVHLNQHVKKVKEINWLTLSTALDLRYRDIVLSAKGNLKEKIIAEMHDKLLKGQTYRILDSSAVNRYLTKETLEMHLNPLAVWKFPKDNDWHLSEVARKYLTAVSSAVPGDIAFDMDKAKLVARRRSNLDPEHLNMMLFLNGNCS